MSRLNCNVINDLLPLYEENLSCAETNALVEEHLRECEYCREKQTRMGGAVVLPKEDGEVIGEIRKKIRRKKFMEVALAALVVFAFCVTVFMHLQAKIYVPYEEVKDILSLEVNGDEMTLSLENTGYLIETSLHEDVEYNEYMYEVLCYTTNWMQMTKQTQTQNVTLEKATLCYPKTESGKAKYVYDGGTIHIGGYQVMERRIVVIYMIYAIASIFVLAIVGLIAIVIRKTRFFKWYLRIVVIPFAYLLAIGVVLVGHDVWYNEQYYIMGASFVTAVITLVAWWAIDKVLYNKETVRK